MSYFVAMGKTPTGGTRGEEDYGLLAGKHVLVVDDELGFGEFVRGLFARYGCQIEVLQDSRSALEQFRARPDDFDLLISDYLMPGITGSELTESVRTLRPDLPVILCTGYMETLISGSNAMGREPAVLRKPVTSSALLSHATRLLGRQA